MADSYKRALIIGASGGIGAALVAANPAKEVIALSRSAGDLDLTDEKSVATAMGALEAPFDLILVASGALEIAGNGPEKSMSAITAEVMAAQFALNAIGPALVIRHAMRLLPREAPGIIACLSARVGSIGDNGLGGWVSYRAAKAALNQIVKTASIELTRTRPQSICVALHPGTVTTPLTQQYLGRHPSVSPDEAARNLLTVLGTLTPDDTGKFIDWAGKEIPW